MAEAGREVNLVVVVLERQDMCRWLWCGSGDGRKAKWVVVVVVGMVMSLQRC